MSDASRYAIIGAGRQGTAAAYDLAVQAGAGSIVMADVDGAVAAQAADRINDLAGRAVATGVALDARDYDAVVDLLEPVDVALAAMPYRFILGCTQAAIQTRTHLVDLGGHTATVRKQLAMHERAQQAGVAIVPDCGMGPGLNNTFAIYAVEQLEARGALAREVRVWDAGLPQDPPQPWGYQCSFHINGLTNEYYGDAIFVRDGKITPVETLTELEPITFDGVGELEAFVASGGTSTVPYAYEGKLQVYENKICRYPGHVAQFKAFKDLGLFEEEPVELPGVGQIVPREFYHHLLAPQLEVDTVIDVCVMRGEGIGERDGRDLTIVIDLVDRYDPATGFTGMERLTGWHASIMMEFIANGEVQPGAWSLEQAISATRFMEKFRARGFAVTERWEE